MLSWLIRKLQRHGAAIYPAKAQAKYKLKWGIDFIETEYIAMRPFSIRAVIDLMLLTKSL